MRTLLTAIAFIGVGISLITCNVLIGIMCAGVLTVFAVLQSEQPK